MKTEDESLGKYVYCTQHLAVHSTGWCTVSNRDKFSLDAEIYTKTEEELIHDWKNSPDQEPRTML